MMTTTIVDRPDDLRLEDPTWYNTDAYRDIAALHARGGIHFYAPLAMWVIARYDDIATVGRNPQIFSNAGGILINDFRYGNVLASFFPQNAENFALSDPPRHNALRKIMIPAFGPKRAGEIRTEIREAAAAALDRIEPGAVVDWWTDIAEHLTVQLFSMILGVPPQDRANLTIWARMMNRMSEATTPEELARAASETGPVSAYFQSLLEHRFANPADDAVGCIAAAVQAGEISIETAHMFVVGIMTAGNGNTVATLNGAMVAFSENPEQLRLLREQPGLAGKAAEELLRWTAPIRGFGRTITQDTEILGVPMKAGQAAINLFMAANRDPAVFPDPDRFDITRDFAKQSMTFGYGQHACIGGPLTRTVVRILLEELAARFGEVEIVDAELDQTSFLLNHPWSRMKVVLR